MNDADMESIAQMASLANNQIPQNEYQSPEDLDGPNGTKRKAEDGQPQQRAKRNRYISIACNEVNNSHTFWIRKLLTSFTVQTS